MNDLDSKKLVLEELRSAYETTISAGHILNDKLQNILSFSSIIFSVVSAIEASTLQNVVGIGFWILIVIALILYLTTVCLILKRGLNPIAYQTPISTNWDELSERYFHKTNEKVVDLTISQYLHSIENLRAVNARKAKTVDVTSSLMIWMILLLLLAIPVGLLLPNVVLSNLV